MINVKKFSVGYMPTNCYLLYSEQEEGVLIDVGGGFGSIHRFLEENNKKIGAILLTHGHFDHIMDAYKWDKEGVKIYIGEEEKSFLTDSELNLCDRVGLTLPSVHNFTTVKDGDTLFFGDIALKCIHTPGHTKGGYCYVCDAIKTIFSGDTIMCETFGNTSFPTGDLDQIVQSIKQKIFTIEGDYHLYSGHGETSTLNHERKMNPVNSL